MLHVKSNFILCILYISAIIIGEYVFNWWYFKIKFCPAFMICFLQYYIARIWFLKRLCTLTGDDVIIMLLLHWVRTCNICFVLQLLHSKLGCKNCLIGCLIKVLLPMHPSKTIYIFDICTCIANIKLYRKIYVSILRFCANWDQLGNRHLA